MKDKICIVVPIYQVERYISRCLDSILNQTYPYWECILIDDGTKDNSAKIAQSYVQRDNRFTLIHQENQGLSAARNMGIEACTSEYISFLDSDDAIDPQFLERLIQCLKEQKADVAIGKYCRFSNQTDCKKATAGKYECLTPLQAMQSVLVLRERYMITAWGKIYKRNLFNDIRYPNGKLHEDEFVTYKIFSKCKKIVRVEDELYYYFTRPDSIMAQYNVKRLVILQAFKESVDYVKETAPALMDEVHTNYIFNLAVAYYRAKSFPKERKWIREEFLNEYTGNLKCSWIKKISLYIFRIWPDLFCLLAKQYLKMIGEDA